MEKLPVGLRHHQMCRGKAAIGRLPSVQFTRERMAGFRYFNLEGAIPDTPTLRTFPTSLLCVVIRSTFIRMLVGTAVASFVWAGAIAWIQRPRIMEGTWINLFEDSKFFEGETISEACAPHFHQAPWLAFYPAPTSKLWRDLNNASKTRSGKLVSPEGTWPVTAYKIKFLGRKRIGEFLGLAPVLGIGYGHLSASGSQVTVERLVSIQEIPAVLCDVR
ncbi:hypothetical protein EDF56_1033 [Novosphingobium sp. PhB165]|uniref:hypothetical protein n=1 Tax=Novosphingobium sp. PhB165 TaxID=2485105 RepID=UPI00104BE636|nr:hypothetical protein [Novosphingobium sp. PhB165]TCM19368.1 hypothetical protein EDF56_1033 [Novosphingobium sp. PhB165]